MSNVAYSQDVASHPASSATTTAADAFPTSAAHAQAVVDVVEQVTHTEQAESITLDQIESIALQSHPSVIGSRWLADAALGQEHQAGLPYNPVLQYQVDEIGNDDAAGLHSFNVSQRFVTAHKLGLAQQVQSHVASQQQADWQRARLVVRTQVRIAFAEALIAQKRLVLNQQLLGVAEKTIHSVESLLAAGEVSKLALLQAKVQVEQASVELDNAVINRDVALRRLAAVAATDLPPKIQLIGDLEIGLDDAPWEPLVAEILAASPELARANAEWKRARSALCLARAQVTPDITAAIGAGVDTVSDDTFANAAISVPIPVRNRNSGGIRAARARMAAASAGVNQTRYDLTNRLADAMSRYRTARQTYQRLTQQIIPLAKETLELSRQAFESGETNFLALLTAQRTLFSTQLDSLVALRNAREALSQIEGQLVTIP